MIKTPLSTVIGGAFWTQGATILGSSSKNLSQLIKSLFSLGEQGFAYDPNDLTTLYQDAVGTIPVTAAGQPVGLMLDKSMGLGLGANLTNPLPSPTIADGGTTSIGTWDSETKTMGNIGGTTSSRPRFGFSFPTVIGRFYKVKGKLSGNLETVLGVSTTLLKNETDGSFYGIINATSTVTSIQVITNLTKTTYLKVDEFSVQEIKGNHAYQSVSAMRPLLVAAPQRLDYDAVDDKLITNLPAQLTGCTVVRSVPNVGTQILTNQTIQTPYNDNIDNCGLIVINRDLTASETSQITKLFNKAAGVTL